MLAEKTSINWIKKQILASYVFYHFNWMSSTDNEYTDDPKHVTIGLVPQHPLELSEGLGEVLQLVVELDVLLYQGVDGVLQFKTTTLLRQENQREKQQHRPKSCHGVDHSIEDPIG